MAGHNPGCFGFPLSPRPIYDRAHPVLRAHRLAWSAKTEERRRAAWWLCWHIAGSMGFRGANPGDVQVGCSLLLPPGSPFRAIDLTDGAGQ